MIQSLQAGRALASLAVVAHHAQAAVQAFAGPFAGASVFHLGYLGVDFFFVLSGFIIFHATVGKGRTAAHYAKGRFQRVYLPYLPVGIGIALLYTILPQLSAASRDWAWLPTLTLAPVNQSTALSVAWTLKHETLFYTIFGLATSADGYHRCWVPGARRYLSDCCSNCRQAWYWLQSTWSSSWASRLQCWLGEAGLQTGYYPRVRRYSRCGWDWERNLVCHPSQASPLP